jgi:hypothetical protein
VEMVNSILCKSINSVFLFYLENDLIITHPDGSRKFYLSLNIHGFEPEEVKIKTQNDTLIISAKKENEVRISLL